MTCLQFVWDPGSPAGVCRGFGYPEGRCSCTRPLVPRVPSIRLGGRRRGCGQRGVPCQPPGAALERASYCAGKVGEGKGDERRRFPVSFDGVNTLLASRLLINGADPRL